MQEVKQKAEQIINMIASSDDAVLTIVISKDGDLHSFSHADHQTRMMMLASLFEDAFEDARHEGLQAHDINEQVTKLLSNVQSRFTQESQTQN